MKHTITAVGLFVGCACAGASTIFHINIGASGASGVADVTTGTMASDYDGDSVNDTYTELHRIFDAALLTDSSGSTADGVTAQVEGWSGFNPSDGAAVGNANTEDVLASSLIWGTLDTHELTVDNLDPGQTYTIEIYGGLNGSDDDPQILLPGELLYDFSANGGASQSGSMQDLYDSSTPITFTGVAPIASSTTINGTEVTNAIHIQNNALGNKVMQFVTIKQEEAVPEPTSLTLLGMGGLALLRRRRG